MDQKMLKNPMKKGFSIIYQRIKVQKWVIQKMKGLKNLINYIK
jgi:hypothetical protein